MVGVWAEVVRQHRALRGAMKQLEEFLSSDTGSFFMFMETVLDFLVRVHAKLEDEQVFPALQKACGQGEFGNTLGRLAADHRLLETLGQTIVGRGRGFHKQLLEERFGQFEKILLEHNMSEEALYQRMVDACGLAAVEEALRPIDPQKVVEGFGKQRYLEFMELAG